MSAVASSLINWSALWKIVLAAVIGGGGLVIMFGFVLLGVERARTAKSGGSRLAHWALVGLCGVCCTGAVAVGIYAMINKPSKPAPKPNPAAHSDAAVSART